MEITYRQCAEPFERYEVSSCGMVRDRDRGRILKQTRATLNGQPGYVKCSLVRSDGERKLMSVHRVVAMAWIPNPDSKSDVNHKDCDKTNNRADNLEWTTHRENIIHGLETVFGWRDALRNHGGKKARPVIAIASDGTETRYDGAKHAARAIGDEGRAGNITSACQCGFVRYGMRWRYADERA